MLNMRTILLHSSNPSRATHCQIISKRTLDLLHLANFSVLKFIVNTVSTSVPSSSVTSHSQNRIFNTALATSLKRFKIRGTLKPMNIRVWPMSSEATDYQYVDPPSCLTSSPCFSQQPLGSSAITGHQVDTNVAISLETLGSDHITVHGGPIYPAYSTWPSSSYTGYRTFVGYNPTGYQAPVKYQNVTGYGGIYGGHQSTSFYSLAPFANTPVQQLSANFRTGFDFNLQNSFEYGHEHQSLSAVASKNYYTTTHIDWGDANAVTAEIKKLKEAWREGTGLKKQRKSRRGEQYQHNPNLSQVYQSRARATCTEESVAANHEEPLVEGPVLSRDVGGCLDQEVSKGWSMISSQMTDFIISDHLEEEIEAMEEFERIELPLSRDETRGDTKSIAKNVPDKKSARIPKGDHSPRSLQPVTKAAKPAVSALLVLKETPTVISKLTTTSTSLTKGLASLRPPKVIAKSSKPTTRPVPFNLTGDVVTRDLKLKREKRHRSVQT